MKIIQQSYILESIEYIFSIQFDNRSKGHSLHLRNIEILVIALKENILICTAHIKPESLMFSMFYVSDQKVTLCFV